MAIATEKDNAGAPPANHGGLIGLVRTYPLGRLLVLVLTAGCLTLLIDIRYEHIDVVHETRISWIPLIYSGLLTLLGAWAFLRWSPASRAILFWGYAVGLAVGMTGLWMHTQGAVFSGVFHVLSAWFQHYHHENVPPQLAPLAFCGIGLMGMLACAKVFQPQENTKRAE
jgi:hypothetical protein